MVPFSLALLQAACCQEKKVHGILVSSVLLATAHFLVGEKADGENQSACGG
jgi:hypothetical protein